MTDQNADPLEVASETEPINFDEDALLEEGIEVVDAVRELAPLSEVLRAVDHACMELDKEDGELEDAVAETAADLRQLTTSSPLAKEGSKSPQQRRNPRESDGRAIRTRGKRGGRKKPRGPRPRAMPKVKRTLERLAQTDGRPHVIVAKRPKPRTWHTSRQTPVRRVEARTLSQGDESGPTVTVQRPPLGRRVIPESSLLDPAVRMEALERERKLINEGPLRASEVPDSMRIGAISGPSSRERLPHEKVIEVPNSVRNYEERKFQTGNLGNPVLRRRTIAYSAVCNAKYDSRRGLEVTDPLSLRELAGIYGGQSPPNLDWTLLHSGRADRYFVINGFISWLSALEHLVIDSGMGVSLAPKCELEKSGKLPPDLTYCGWLLPGLGIVDVAGPVVMDLRLGSVVEPVEFYITDSITTAILGRDVIISHGLCYFEEFGRFYTSQGDVLRVKLVPRNKGKRPVV